MRSVVYPGSLLLTPDAYDRLIEKHGQYVRWVRAQPCHCIAESGQPDASCGSCKGRGVLYSRQMTADIRGENSIHSGSEIDPDFHPVSSAKAVRDPMTGNEWTILSFSDAEILIQTNPTIHTLPEPYHPIEVDYSFSLEKTVTGVPIYLGERTFSAPVPAVQTIQGDAIQGDVTSVSSLANVTRSITYRVVEAARAEVYVEWANPADEPMVGDVLAITFKYCDPLVGLLVGVTERMRLDDSFVAVGGEAALTVPYWCLLGTHDLVTQLCGEQRGAGILRAAASVDDELPAFEVVSLTRVVDEVKEYAVGTDCILWGRNKIRWLTTKPTGSYSVLFTYHPTFSVLQARPLLRTGERQRFPRRVSLEAFDKVSPHMDATVPVVGAFR